MHNLLFLSIFAFAFVINKYIDIKNITLDYKEFFTTDNKSGWKTREDRLKTNFPDVYNELTSFFNINISLVNHTFKEKIWFFINNVKEHPKCEECKIDLKFGKSISEGFPKYCSLKCTNKNENHIKISKEKKLEKYGNYNNFEQYKKTMLEKHGVENMFEKTEYIQSKFFEKYGETTALHVKEFKDKWEKSNIERCGFKNNLLIEGIREKSHKKRTDDFLLNNSNLNIINVNYNNITISCDKCKSDYIINRSVLWHRQNYKVECCVNCNPIEYKTKQLETELLDYMNIIDIFNKLYKFNYDYGNLKFIWSK